MSRVDTSQLRRATPWFCWDVPKGEFYATVADALQAPGPDDVALLLVQYRFDDDGSLAGRAQPVFPINQIGSSS